MTADDSPSQLQKCPTGITGLDEILNGGFPRGRPTLVCGAAGSGKTLLAMEFIVRGARDQREPGVFMSFEETEEELVTNVASLGFDLPALSRKNLIAIDHVHLERSEIIDTGDYDLEGLFVRLDAMIKGIGAQRVAIDSLEALFAYLPNEAILRAELRRLFRWLKERGVTAVITGEQGQGSLTRHGLEEYISDCVIFLDHRIVNQVATRRLRVVKYRGTVHGTSEYPTMVDERGLSVFPITSLGLDYPVTNERILSGVAELDRMLEGQGYFRGSSILVSGTAGTGKSSFAAAFIEGACERGEQGLFLAFEEPPAQILRNMASIGYQLEPYVKKGLVVPITRGIFRSYPAGPEHFGGSRGQGQSTLPTKSVRCLHSPAAVRTGGRLRRKSAAHAKAPSLRQFPAEVGLSHSAVPVGIKSRSHKHTIAASPRSS